MAAQESSSGSTASNQGLYLGLGVGVGGLLLTGIIAIVVQIIRRSRQFRHTQSLEQGLQVQHEVAQTAPLHDASILGINEHKWEALSSKENVNEQSLPSRKSVVLAFHFPKRMKKRGIALRKLKRLSAIVESPRSQNVLAMPALVEEQKEESHAETQERPAKDFFLEEPQIQSWEGLFAHDRPRAPRSVSVSALLESHAQNGLQRSMSGNVGVRTHVRSVSLGAAPPATLPPDPVPHTVIPPMGQENTVNLSRRTSKDSYCSDDSAHSSVLAKSPCLNRQNSLRLVKHNGRPSSIRLQKSANRVVVINGSHDPQAHAVDRVGSKVSLLTDEEKMSRSYLVSSSSVSSLEDDEALQTSSSMPTFRFPQQPIASPRSAKSRRNQSSVRRTSRFSVSADGSPTGHKRPGILQDICGNALPIRDLSNTSLRSTNSSDGNPFQWDGIASSKPSAMKGSPNARKGHKRQNCVRISTLTPQVLGPPPSRPDSPSITHGIREEISDGSPKSLTFVSNKRPPRPTSVGPNNSLRVKTLRASLTPSSPTLSLWAAYSDYHLPSQQSDSHLTVSSAGRLSRTGSGISSIYSIPQFPNPSTVTVSEVQHDQPVPEFYISSPDVDGSTATYTQHDPPSPSVQHDSPPLSVQQDGRTSRKRARNASPPESQMPWSSRPPSTVSLSSNDPTTPAHAHLPAYKLTSEDANQPATPAHAPFKLTSENASSSLQNSAFPGAPVLPPPPDDSAAWRVQTPRHCSRGSPSGPRIEPAKSVAKFAMELRRMNSEIDTTICRESRRYLRFNREASPMLPLFSSPNPSESCADMFDFGFNQPSSQGQTPQQSDYQSDHQSRFPDDRFKGQAGTPNSLYDADGFLRP